MMDYPPFTTGDDAPSAPDPTKAEPRPGPRAKLPVTIVVGVLAIVLGIGGGYLLTRLVDNRPGPTAGDSPAAVVRQYLEAVAAGDADTALALGAGQPSDTTLMTPEVLALANARAPITEIDVSDTDEWLVPASYLLGDQRVTAEILVVDTDDGPKLEQTWGVLRLNSAAGPDLSRIVYGVEITAEETPVFPGVYPVGTGRELIDWGERATAVISRPESWSSGDADLQPRLTEAGEEAFATATREFLDRCLQARQLAPEGCPFSARPRGEVTPDSVVWTTPDGDPMAAFEPRIDFDNVYLATARFDFVVVARWQEDGQSMNTEQYVGGRATMDLSDDDNPVFAWQN